MLRASEGATLGEIANVTGWQRHSIRGAISGALKKKLGLIILSQVGDRGRVYRITPESMLSAVSKKTKSAKKTAAGGR